MPSRGLILAYNNFNFSIDIIGQVWYTIYVLKYKDFPRRRLRL